MEPTSLEFQKKQQVVVETAVVETLGLFPAVYPIPALPITVPHIQVHPLCPSAPHTGTPHPLTVAKAFKDLTEASKTSRSKSCADFNSEREESRELSWEAPPTPAMSVSNIIYNNLLKKKKCSNE